MTNLTLDHIGIMGAALPPMARQFERLGFRLAPLSQHHGAREPGGPVTRWGTGNHCIMLRQGYLELLAVVEPALFDNRVPEYVARYPGAHILAFGCDAAEVEAERLRALGLARGVARLERPLGEAPDAPRLTFDLVRIDADALPEGRVLIIRHGTPELLWQPALLDHPNGALSLQGVSVVVDDPAARAAHYAAVLGTLGEPHADGVSFGLARGHLHLLSAAGAARRGWDPSPCRPHVAAMEVGVASLDATRALLRSAGLPFTGDDTRLLVPAAEAAGVTCCFVPAALASTAHPHPSTEACK